MGDFMRIAPSNGQEALLESDVPRQRWRRIIPVALAMYTIAYIDHTNISLALPSMSLDLRMGPEQAGSAAGVFFWGYLLLQIPGGYLAERWSAKKVVSILLVLWGACAAGSGLLTTPRGFWVMRVLLGVAEGGVFPATIILLANWFPPAERARANAYWMLCQPLAIVVSSPLSGWILGHWNWRVLLVAEGALPFVWLAVWIMAIDDRPAAARWLSSVEREYLVRALPPTRHTQAGERIGSIAQSFGDLPTLMLVALYFFLNCGGYGYLFWLPSALLAVKSLPSLARRALRHPLFSCGGRHGG
jgi:MFS family permease